MKALLLLILLGSSWPVLSQAPQPRPIPTTSERDCKSRKQSGVYDAFAKAIKNGETGDGVHYPWMDKMRELGIKQAFFIVHVSYRNGEYKYKVTTTSYYLRYYCDESEVKDSKLLRDIRKFGLDQDLRQAIVARLKRFERPYHPGDAKDDERYCYLLDNESLPIIDFVT